jgi:hypothetical protein
VQAQPRQQWYEAGSNNFHPERLMARFRPATRNLVLMATLALAFHSQASAQPAAEVPQVTAPANPDPQWRPSAAQVAQVQARTRSYFQARDAGRFDEAHGFFAPSQKATLPLAEWRGAIEAFNVRAGRVASRTPRTVTWYKDAPRRPPGTYAAVDFSSQFTNLALHCGYVVWQEQPDGAFALIREQENVVDKATEATLNPGELEQMRQQFGC